MSRFRDTLEGSVLEKLSIQAGIELNSISITINFTFICCDIYQEKMVHNRYVAIENEFNSLSAYTPYNFSRTLPLNN